MRTLTIIGIQRNNGTIRAEVRSQEVNPEYLDEEGKPFKQYQDADGNLKAELRPFGGHVTAIFEGAATDLFQGAREGDFLEIELVAAPEPVAAEAPTEE